MGPWVHWECSMWFKSQKQREQRLNCPHYLPQVLAIWGHGVLKPGSDTAAQGEWEKAREGRAKKSNVTTSEAVAVHFPILCSCTIPIITTCLVLCRLLYSLAPQTRFLWVCCSVWQKDIGSISFWFCGGFSMDQTCWTGASHGCSFGLSPEARSVTFGSFPAGPLWWAMVQ